MPSASVAFSPLASVTSTISVAGSFFSVDVGSAESRSTFSSGGVRPVSARSSGEPDWKGVTIATPFSLSICSRVGLLASTASVVAAAVPSLLLLPLESEHEAADVSATQATAASAIAFFLKLLIVLRPFISFIIVVCG